MTKKKDISVTPAKDRKILAEDAKAIRKLGKSTIKNLIEIGRRLTRDKELVGHGNWGLEVSLGGPKLNELASKNRNLRDLNLNV